MDAQMMGRSTPSLMVDLLLEALKVKNERLNALAVEIIGRLGTDVLHRLILEASSRKNRPAHRARILQAIARIGTFTDELDYYDLLLLTHDKSAEVRNAAALAILEFQRRLWASGSKAPEPRETPRRSRPRGESFVGSPAAGGKSEAPRTDG